MTMNLPGRTYLPSISPNVDSCHALINKKAREAHWRIGANNRRFVDLEDCQQEGLIAAWAAEKSFDPQKSKYKQTIKYSSYLVPGLKHAYHNAYHSSFHQGKRTALQVLPLEMTAAVNMADSSVSVEALENAVSVFKAIAEKLSPSTAEKFVAGLLSGRWFGRVGGRYHHIHASIKEMRRAVKAVGASFEDLSQFIQNPAFRTRALIAATKLTNIKMSRNGMAGKILECVGCSQMYSLADVKAGRYSAETFTCVGCYREMQDTPAVLSCFGKVKTATSEGYDVRDVECRLHCRDRRICKQFVTESEGE